MLHVWWCLLALCAQSGAEPAPAPVLFGGRSTYELETTLVLNELAGKHRDVGYRLRAELVLEPTWADPDEQRVLLKFRLQSPELLLRGAAPNAEYVRHGSLWDAPALRDSAFYALWHRGRVLAAHLDPTDPPDVLDYKRSLISLFQFQLVDGEYKETDVSGDCDVIYETISPTVFRKIKRRCAYEADAGAGGDVRARRVSRYTLSSARDVLSALHAEELVWLAVSHEGEHALGVKARSWHALTLRSHEAGFVPAAGALPALPRALVDTPLPLPLRDHDQDEQEESLESALKSHGVALAGWEAGAGGAAEEAAALAPLLRAVRAAPAPALRALLDAPALKDLLPGVCRALGLAGSHAAWLAVRPLLAPAERDALQAPAQHYLAGFALSAEPQEETVVEILKLGEEAKIDSIATSALLAGAAGAARCGSAVQRAVRDQLARGLARCRDESCRAVRLRALGHLRLADSAALLLAAAERGGGEDAAAALSALRAEPLSAAHVERVALLAHNASRPLLVRALALELAAERSTASETGAVPLVVVRLAHALGGERGAAAHELRRALWQRLDSLEEREAVRALRRVLPRDLRSWDARAHAGTTSVLRRATGWAGGGWAAQLDSVQLASRGLLRRGAVTLLGAAAAPAADVAELLSVEVWTRGLQAVAKVAGAGEEGDAEGQETPAAGLQLAVRGVALSPVQLFDGQAELVGHIWAGTGSAPTAVLRALAPLGARRARVPLQAGAVLAARGDAAGALALDAHATVSLWHSTARAGLALRAAAHARVTGSVRTAWSSLRADVAAEGAPRLRLAVDLDFYDKVALCVRSDLAPHTLRHSVKLVSTGGARALHVTRTRTVLTERAGRTLSLGRDNDAACRVLRAAEE